MGCSKWGMQCIGLAELLPRPNRPPDASGRTSWGSSRSKTAHHCPREGPGSSAGSGKSERSGERAESAVGCCITYVRTTSGFCYTAFVTDAFSRKIVGWSTRTTMRTDALPLKALEHALLSARDQALDRSVHHSDRADQHSIHRASGHSWSDGFRWKRCRCV